MEKIATAARTDTAIAQGKRRAPCWNAKFPDDQHGRGRLYPSAGSYGARNCSVLGQIRAINSRIASRTGFRIQLRHWLGGPTVMSAMRAENAVSHIN